MAETQSPGTRFDTVLEMHELQPRLVEVVSARPVTPELRRLELRAEHADTFPFRVLAPDDHVKLFFPTAAGELIAPVMGPGFAAPGAVERPEYRDYTVRGFDRESGLVTIDFVLHDHGVAGRWAGAAQPGDRLWMLGPRGSHIYSAEFDWYLLAADETSIPALSRWLEELPAHKRVIAFVEVAGPGSEPPLPERPDTRVVFLHRDGREPGDLPLLDEAVRALERPEGEFFAWIAGESATIKPVRRFLRRELGLPKERVKVDGYWRRGVVNLDHHEEEED